MKKSKAIALLSAGLVAGLVLGTVGVSYAATGTDGQTAACGIGARAGQSMRDAGGRLADIVAGLTGLTVDEVRAERRSGRSIADIAEANGVSGEDVIREALAARKAVLDERVADGTLTQEQADAAYAQMTERLSERVAADETGAPAWSGRGRGRMDGAGQGACGACATNQ